MHQINLDSTLNTLQIMSNPDQNDGSFQVAIERAKVLCGTMIVMRENLLNNPPNFLPENCSYRSFYKISDPDLCHQATQTAIELRAGMPSALQGIMSPVLDVTDRLVNLYRGQRCSPPEPIELSNLAQSPPGSPTRAAMKFVSSVSVLDSAKSFLSAIASKISAAAQSVWAGIADWRAQSNEANIAAMLKRHSEKLKNLDANFDAIPYDMQTMSGQGESDKEVLAYPMKYRSVLYLKGRSNKNNKWLAFKVNDNFDMVVVDLRSGVVQYAKDGYGMQTVKKGWLASLLSGESSETDPTKILAFLNKKFQKDCLNCFKEALENDTKTSIKVPLVWDTLPERATSDFWSQPRS